MSKKLLAAIFTVMLLLCGCGEPVSSQNVDYGYVEGYYSDLGYEVKTSDGAVSEQFYFLNSDEELTDPVGYKSVYFDEKTGEMTKYVIRIGVIKSEKLVNYSTGDGSTFYNEMYFDEDENLTNVVWKNEYPAEGGNITEEGSEEYYPGTMIKKKSEYKRFQNGKVIETSLKEYDEEGKLINEVVE